MRPTGQDVQVHSMASEPTFFGNYAPPDDLDGQIIDLAPGGGGARGRQGSVFVRYFFLVDLNPAVCLFGEINPCV